MIKHIKLLLCYRSNKRVEGYEKKVLWANQDRQKRILLEPEQKQSSIGPFPGQATSAYSVYPNQNHLNHSQLIQSGESEEPQIWVKDYKSAFKGLSLTCILSDFIFLLLAVISISILPEDDMHHVSIMYFNGLVGLSAFFEAIVIFCQLNSGQSSDKYSVYNRLRKLLFLAIIFTILQITLSLSIGLAMDVFETKDFCMLASLAEVLILIVPKVIAMVVFKKRKIDKHNLQLLEKVPSAD